MKALIKLAIAALLVHASWRSGTAFWRYYEFKDGVQATAQFAGARSSSEIHNRVIEIANELDVPINPETIEVRKEQNHTYVDAAYTERIELVPNYYYYPWQFKVSIDAFTIAIPAVGGLPME